MNLCQLPPQHEPNLQPKTALKAAAPSQAPRRSPQSPPAPSTHCSSAQQTAPAAVRTGSLIPDSAPAPPAFASPAVSDTGSPSPSATPVAAPVAPPASACPVPIASGALYQTPLGRLPTICSSHKHYPCTAGPTPRSC